MKSLSRDKPAASNCSSLETPICFPAYSSASTGIKSFRARIVASRMNPLRGTHTKTPQGRSSECQRCTCTGCLAVRISFQCCSSSDPELFRPKESQPIISRPFLPIPPRRRLYTERKSVTSPNWNNAIYIQERNQSHITPFASLYFRYLGTFINPSTARNECAFKNQLSVVKSFGFYLKSS